MLCIQLLVTRLSLVTSLTQQDLGSTVRAGLTKLTVFLQNRVCGVVGEAKSRVAMPPALL